MPWNTGHSLLKTRLKMLISVETTPVFPVVHRKCIYYYVNLVSKTLKTISILTFTELCYTVNNDQLPFTVYGNGADGEGTGTI